MASLFSALHASSDSLQALQKSLAVVQNNIGNASTPGYIEQVPVMEAAAFDVSSGLSGGSKSEQPTPRDNSSDPAIRQEMSDSGYSSTSEAALAQVNSQFDITGQGGIAAAFNQVFSAFSALSASPSDAAVQQQVISSAQVLASAFQTAAQNLRQQEQTTSDSVTSVVAQINALASTLQQLNSITRGTGPNNPAVDASRRQTLEALSGLVDISVHKDPDGSLSVLLGGQTPLVIGDKQFTLSTGYSAAGAAGSGLPAQSILDATGADITNQATRGQLGALLSIRNDVLPKLVGGAGQDGDLNRLAASFAERVNSLLRSGTVPNGGAGVPGTDLFTFDTSDVTRTAATLKVVPGFGPGSLALADATSINGVANQLAGISRGANAADQIDGRSFAGFYAALAANAGQQLSSASTQNAAGQQSLVQLRSLRDQVGGVSLDRQAELLLQFQRSYQAVAKLVSVLDQVTQSSLSLIP